MTRIDLHTPPPPARIDSEPAAPHHHRSNWLTRLFWTIVGRLVKLLVGIFLLCLPFVYLLAAAGIISVPIVGGLIYHTPMSDHLVTAGIPFNDAALKSLVFHESMLTASLQNGLAGEGSRLFEASGSQVAVVNGHGVEVFLPFMESEQRSALIIGLTLDLEDGKVSPRLTSLHVGNLPIAPSIANLLVISSLRSAIESFNNQISQVVTIASIDYANGSVIVNK